MRWWDFFFVISIKEEGKNLLNKEGRGPNTNQYYVYVLPIAVYMYILNFMEYYIHTYCAKVTNFLNQILSIKL